MTTGAEWSFRCTACGKCCNSAPELSVPELFQHQHRFVGRLAVRRVSRRDAASEWLLVTHAWSDERLARCPALEADGRCSIHADKKPDVCGSAPLDALVPDTLAHVVLAQRAQEAAFFGANCLAPGERAGFTPLVRRLRVVDPLVQRALARRRAALVLEKRFWGQAVFRMLERDLFADPQALARIPENGFMSLSLAPVLMVVAAVSPRCRARCIEYLEAQLPLAASLGLADVTRVHGALLEALRARDEATAAPGSTRGVNIHGADPAPNAAAAEAWLGLEQAA